MRNLLFILLVTLFYSGVAQTSNKKRVLVIPPDRFQFSSEFDLNIIAEKNNIQVSEVFLMYEKALLSSFAEYQDENFEFIPAKSASLKPYKRRIKYKYGKFNRKPYNAVDLSQLTEENFTNLLEQHQADFVIFITWYDIKKQTVMKGPNNWLKYPGYYFDYDVYNLFKQHVFGAAKVKGETPKPISSVSSESLYKKEGVKVANANFIEKVVLQLNKPIELK